MGIVLKDNQQYKVETTLDMKPGDFAVIIEEGYYSGHILFRNGDRSTSKLIDLTEVKSWTVDPKFIVRILPSGTSFQIE